MQHNCRVWDDTLQNKTAERMSLRSWSQSSWLTPLLVPLLLLLPSWSLCTKFFLLVLISTAWILAKSKRSTHPTPSNNPPHTCKATCSTSCRDRVIALDQASLLVWLYRALPWVRISRKFGEFAEKKLPAPLVVVLVWVYAWLFGCNLEEADPTSVWDYESLGSFFRRKLRHGSRPVSSSSRIVIPADGTLTFSGAYTGGSLQQVKGVFYSLPKFLGREVQPEGLLRRSGTCLYQTVIYLCPGDYHRFHSPTKWRVEERTHIWGELLSVAPPILRNVQGLFTLNERIVLEGTWRFGYFGMVAVGATNVGSITIDCLPELVTNTKHKQNTKTHFGIERRNMNNPVELAPGQNVGNFSFGSSIVLLFEAPVGLEFLTSSFRKVKYGEHFL